jgi:two-component system, OmpR family, sensor histidine kinase KdpD
LDISGSDFLNLRMHGMSQVNSGKQSVLGLTLRSALRALPGSVVVGLVTFICFGLHLNFPTVSFFYLIAVVLQSLIGDFFSSVIVSGLSFLCLNYFFVPPIFSMSVRDSSNTLALISFLVAGLVITRLTSQARMAAESEELQRKEMTRLYELARQLLALEPAVTVDANLLKPFCTEFNLRAACLFDAATAKLHIEGDSLNHLAECTRDAYISGRDFHDRGAAIAVRLLRIGGRTAGAIGFEGLRDFDLTAGPLAALATIMVERCQAFEQASHAAATTEAELFRGAVLDALAHEFKTPLATIVTAAGGIRGAGPLRREQSELAETVEEEASRLGQLTTRLLRLARLDREEVKPQMELTDIRDVVSSIVEQYSRRWPDRQFSLADGPRVDVLGDRELLWLGLNQLLDNACKYSRPASAITLSIESRKEALVIRVWNSGSSISLRERARIFERFYRGVEARRLAPGSGLGLYVARKIAVAHGGDLHLEKTEDEEGTAFCFAIARSGEQSDHEAEIQCASGG